MKTLLTIFALMYTLHSAAQDTLISRKGLAHTYKRQGVEIYILTDPVREYEVTGKVTSDDAVSWLNAISGTETQRDLTQSIDVLISNANRKAKKGKFQFDAIITEDGSTGTCIKFK